MNNFIIGGVFDINPWQRGTSFVSVADAVYTADRFQYHKSGTMVHDVSKNTAAPTATGNLEFQPENSILIDCTTADVAIAAADYCYMNTKVEGYNLFLDKIRVNGLWLGFFVMSTRTGIHCVSVRNAGLDRTCLFEVDIAAAMVWQYVSVNIPTIPTTGTWDFANGVGLDVAITLAAGSNYRDLTNTTGSWLTGNYLSTDNQENFCDNVINSFWIDLVSLTEDDNTPFAFSHAEDFQTVLNRCQRYYEKSYNQGVDPGTATTVGISSSIMPVATSANLIGLQNNFAVTKRATPVITWYAATGTSGNITDAGAGDVAVTGNVAEGACSTGYPTIGAATAANVSGHWTADAEL
jgi:hypothetical protein